jgi:iron only hydrogenase large subunit-like protein
VEFTSKGTPDVDTVLTSTEIVEIINRVEETATDEEQKFSTIMKKLDHVENYKTYQSAFTMEELIVQSLNLGESTKSLLAKQLVIQPGQRPTSNSYVEAVLRIYIKDILKDHPDNVQINCTTGKNSDIEEYSVLYKEKEVMQVARIYGLRNIQNLMRNLKKGTCKYKYVEIMACPSGCLNGGGQIKPKLKEIKPKELVSLLHELISDAKNKITRRPEDNGAVSQIIQAMGNKIVTRAHYKSLEKQSSSSILKW